MPSRKSVNDYAAKTSPKKRDAADDERLIKQYFAVWGVADDYGTRPMKGCFTKSINERGPNSSAANKIVVLNQHDHKKPLCKPSVLLEDEIGLYGEYKPDEGITENDDLVVRVRSGTINGGSYGFTYVWDKMEYDDKTDEIMMFECETFEVSPSVLPSQVGTFVVRDKNGKLFDETLELDTESFIKKIPRAQQLEIRSLINRHISLATAQPHQQKRNALDKSKPKQRVIDYDYLLENL